MGLGRTKDKRSIRKRETSVFRKVGRVCSFAQANFQHLQAKEVERKKRKNGAVARRAKGLKSKKRTDFRMSGTVAGYERE